MRNSFFKQNEHAIERVLRIVIGAVLLALVFVGPKTPIGWLGVILLGTGIAGTCPIYSILGISTCRTDNKKRSATT